MVQTLELMGEKGYTEDQLTEILSNSIQKIDIEKGIHYLILKE